MDRYRSYRTRWRRMMNRLSCALDISRSVEIYCSTSSLLHLWSTGTFNCMLHLLGKRSLISLNSHLKSQLIAQAIMPSTTPRSNFHHVTWFCCKLYQFVEGTRWTQGTPCLYSYDFSSCLEHIMSLNTPAPFTKFGSWNGVETWLPMLKARLQTSNHGFLCFLIFCLWSRLILYSFSLLRSQ